MNKTKIEKLHRQLRQMILNADRDEANDLIDTWAADKSYHKALTEMLEPVLRKIGDEWNCGEISLAQGYVAGKIAEDILQKAYVAGEIMQHDNENQPPVILCNIEDDFHALGRKMVGTFLRAAGWHVIDMGNDVTAEEMVDKAQETGASIIGVSAMMFTTAENIKKVREEIEKRGLGDRLKLAVGGAVFKLRPELVAYVGGDGTADSCMTAPDLFKKLYSELEGEDV